MYLSRELRAPPKDDKPHTMVATRLPFVNQHDLLDGVTFACYVLFGNFRRRPFVAITEFGPMAFFNTEDIPPSDFGNSSEYFTWYPMVGVVMFINNEGYTFFAPSYWRPCNFYFVTRTLLPEVFRSM